MKKMVIAAVLLMCFHPVQGQDRRDSLLVMFWNLENFFDYTDQGTGESDKEFSSGGSRYWTKRKFYAKCDAISKSIFWIGDSCGRLPDLIGLAEVENRGVLARLLNSTLLRKIDYRIIHYDSPDRRGIDVAILYRQSSMNPISISLQTTEYQQKRLATRDILHASMAIVGGDTIDFMVNHHPSKFGGDAGSAGRRSAAMTALKHLCDSTGSDSVIAMGDFNDTPDAEAFTIVDGILVNKGMSLHKKGEGSIRYEGKWDLIDMFLVSPSLESRTTMEVCRIPFLMTWESRHPGYKPLRTYSGPRYLGGISDHCPVILHVR